MATDANHEGDTVAEEQQPAHEAAPADEHGASEASTAGEQSPEQPQPAADAQGEHAEGAATAAHAEPHKAPNFWKRFFRTFAQHMREAFGYSDVTPMGEEYEGAAKWADASLHVAQCLRDSSIAGGDEQRLLKPLNTSAAELSSVHQAAFAAAVHRMGAMCTTVTSAHAKCNDTLRNKVSVPLGPVIDKLLAVHKAEERAEEKRVYFDGRRRKADKHPTDQRRQSELRSEQEFNTIKADAIAKARSEASSTGVFVRRPMGAYVLAQLEYHREAVKAYEELITDPAFADFVGVRVSEQELNEATSAGRKSSDLYEAVLRTVLENHTPESDGDKADAAPAAEAEAEPAPAPAPVAAADN